MCATETIDGYMCACRDSARPHRHATTCNLMYRTGNCNTKSREERVIKRVMEAATVTG